MEHVSPDEHPSLRNAIVKAHCGMDQPNYDRFIRILRLGDLEVLLWLPWVLLRLLGVPNARKMPVRNRNDGDELRHLEGWG